MKVFLDTNVLVSDFMWKGTCALVIEEVWANHQPMTGEVVLEEVEEVLRRKFQISADDVRTYIDIFRRHYVEPIPEQPVALPIDDPDDEWVLASAVNGGADILITGDKAFRGCDNEISGIKLRTPREFLDLMDE